VSASLAAVPLSPTVDCGHGSPSHRVEGKFSAWQAILSGCAGVSRSALLLHRNQNRSDFDSLTAGASQPSRRPRAPCWSCASILLVLESGPVWCRPLVTQESIRPDWLAPTDLRQVHARSAPGDRPRARWRGCLCARPALFARRPSRAISNSHSAGTLTAVRVGSAGESRTSVARLSLFFSGGLSSFRKPPAGHCARNAPRGRARRQGGSCRGSRLPLAGIVCKPLFG
jgi:hypothetical protein